MSESEIGGYCPATVEGLEIEFPLRLIRIGRTYASDNFEFYYAIQTVEEFSHTDRRSSGQLETTWLGVARIEMVYLTAEFALHEGWNRPCLCS